MDIDIEKYKSNPKTAYLARTYLELNDEESKQMILEEMDKILLGDVSESEEGEFPNEVVLEVRAGAGGEEARAFCQEIGRNVSRLRGSQGLERFGNR